MPTIRSVTSFSPAPAASANFSSAAALGSPRRGTANCTASLFFLRVFSVGIDDARHQRMPHPVLRAELREGDAAHAREDPARLDQRAFLPAPAIDLLEAAVDHRLRADSEQR